MLLKGSGCISHGGGQLFGRDHAAYRTIAKWISEGARDDKPAPLVKLEVTAGSKRLDGANTSAQLTATAHFADGSTRDVTALTVFTTGESAAKATPGGRVTFSRTGEASVLARYLTGITSARFTYVNRDTQFNFRAPAANNVIDAAVFAKPKELQLLPAAVCSDEVFLRACTSMPSAHCPHRRKPRRSSTRRRRTSARSSLMRYWSARSLRTSGR